MAQNNPFTVRVPNVLESLMVFDDSYDGMRKNVRERDASLARQEAAQAIQSGGDSRGALARLLGVGDMAGVGAISSLQNNEADRAWRREEAARSQKNTDAQMQLQRLQIAASQGNAAAQQALARAQFEFQKEVANRADIRPVKDAAGNETLVRIDRLGNPTPIQIPGQQQEPNNPFLTGGQMNESQAKDGLYANRMLASERELRKVETSAMTMRDQARDEASNLLGFNLRSPEHQKLDQAKRDFINATLRRESGAVISPAEFDNANKQYFPMPGDTPEVVKQKRANRLEAIKGIGAGAGKGWRPNLNIDQAGNIVERSNGPQPAQADPLGIR